MKKYMKITKIIMATLSAMTGYALYSLPMFKAISNDKLAQITLLIPLFSILQLLVERGAVKRLGDNTKLQLRGNPALRMTIFMYIFILIAGVFIYFRFEINSLSQSISFSIMVYCFVGAIFETSNFFRRVIK